MFATDRELIAMQECSTIYFDGTFRSTPRPYAQIVTFHGLFRNTQWIIPLGMALLGGKTMAHYQCMLLSLKAGVLNASGRPLAPTETLTDFEASLMQSIRLELPATMVHGCYFHYCSALWRRVQELGLQLPYRQDRRVKKFIRKLMALGYLPLAHVRGSFA